jgi:Tol biopolymer transport system component
MAQPFDTSRLAVHGEPVAIADGVWTAALANHASFSASENGTIAYVNATEWDRQLAWFDRGGRPLGLVGSADRSWLTTPQLSPDGQRVAVARGEEFSSDTWILDATRGTSTRLTFGAKSDAVPMWAADGHRILLQTGPRAIVRNLESGSEDVLFESAIDRVADWSRDGRFLMLSRGTDLWVVDLAGDRRPFPFLETPTNERQAQLSPNGKWIAYTSNETGRDEVYVQRFPVPGAKYQVSQDGGAMPRWRRDGAELFFLTTRQFLTAVPIHGETSLEIGPPVSLFRTRLILQGSESSGGLVTTYDVTPDGQRFLLNGPPENPAPPMTLVFNWTLALKK